MRFVDKERGDGYTLLILKYYEKVWKNMNWLNKLERKIGRFAIPNLIIWLLGAYVIGFVLNMMYPEAISILSFHPYLIFQGQVWRLVTWIFQPTNTNIFWLLISLMFYYQLGMNLERVWGTFRFNVYLVGGMLFTVVGSLLFYGIVYMIFGVDVAATASSLMSSFVSTYYVNMSLYLAFAVMYPNLQVLIYFIIPVKVKWMAIVYVVIMVYDIFSVSQAYGAYYGTGMGILVAFIMLVVNVMSLLNFVVFYLSSKDMKRYAPKEVKRRQEFKRQMAEPRPGSGISRHKCAVCGRTELSNPELEFRFCSKCEGNFEYCQDHLFTHEHVHRS